MVKSTLTAFFIGSSLEKLYLDLIAAATKVAVAKDPSITISALAYILICLNPNYCR